MKKLLIVGVLFCAALASAQQKGGSTDAVTALKAIEDQWTQAELKGDAAWFSSILADNWVTTSAEGVVRGKADFIGRIKSGDVKITASNVADMKVTVHGDAAVVTGRWDGKGTEKGKAFSESVRWTDFFVKINGKWQCVASQSTPIK